MGCVIFKPYIYDVVFIEQHNLVSSVFTVLFYHCQIHVGQYNAQNVFFALIDIKTIIALFRLFLKSQPIIKPFYNLNYSFYKWAAQTR